MGHQRILKNKEVGNESCWHMEVGANETFTVRSMGFVCEEDDRKLLKRNQYNNLYQWCIFIPIIVQTVTFFSPTGNRVQYWASADSSSSYSEQSLKASLCASYR